MKVRIHEGMAETTQPLILRLVIRRKDAQQAEAERKRLLKDAKKRGKQPDPRSLEAAKYILLLTSLPADAFPPADVLALYRFRWQIELAFKRFKSLAGLDQLPAKKPALARTWIYARLIVAIIAEQIAGQVRILPPVDHIKRAQSPSRWRLVKIALATVAAAIRGPISWTTIRGAIKSIRRHLCEAPRQRKNNAILS